VIDAANPGRAARRRRIMLIKKTLLAAAAVMTLAAPAAAMAQDFGGHHDAARFEPGRYEQRGNFAWRQVEREREIQRSEWRARFEHRHFRSYDEYRAY
jgi:hypothetical protein